MSPTWIACSAIAVCHGIAVGGWIYERRARRIDADRYHRDLAGLREQQRRDLQLTRWIGVERIRQNGGAG